MKKGRLSERMDAIEGEMDFICDCANEDTRRIDELTERVRILEEQNGDLESAMIDLLSHLYVLLADEDRKEIKKIARGLGVKLNKS